jgi:hypothetical protein
VTPGSGCTPEPSPARCGYGFSSQLVSVIPRLDEQIEVLPRGSKSQSPCRLFLPMATQPCHGERRQVDAPTGAWRLQVEDPWDPSPLTIRLALEASYEAQLPSAGPSPTNAPPTPPIVWPRYSRRGALVSPRRSL